MARTGTERRPEPVRASRDEMRTLVVIDGGEHATRGAAPAWARPRAEFLTQLLVSADPAMRPSRIERTRAAAARYAETARRSA